MIPINRTQVSKSNPVLFIPVVNMISDDIDHEGAFWGIGFPVRAFSFNQSAVDIVEKYLEGGGFAILNARLQGFDLALVLPAVITE
jgi:hypothetical protein